MSTDGDCGHEIKRHLLLERKAIINLDSILKSRGIGNKGPSSQSYSFSSSHVWIWELDYKKAEHQRTDAFELWCWRRLKSPLDCKKIKPVNSKWNQSWIFIGRTDAEAKTPILWPLDVKNWLILKDPDAGKDQRWEEKGTAEEEMVVLNQQLNGHESE